MPGSEAYSTWLDPPALIYVNFYFFNVTNVQQFIDGSARPHVVERGPYVYRNIQNKTDVELINDGATLRYRQQKWYIFDANRSRGSEDDLITTVNIPLVVSYMPVYAASSRMNLLSTDRIAHIQGWIKLFGSSGLDRR